MKKETLEEFYKIHMKTSLLESIKKHSIKVFYYELCEVYITFLCRTCSEESLYKNEYVFIHVYHLI